MSQSLSHSFSIALLALLAAFPSAGHAEDIPVSDTNVTAGLSPYNWVRTGGYSSSAGTGSSLSVRFTGTRTVVLRVDTGIITTPKPSRFPIIAWSVNGGAFHTHQLAPGETTVPLCSGFANPLIDLYVKGISPYEDRFNGDVPANSVKITGFTVDPGGHTSEVYHPSKIWVNIGDSIMAGDAASYTAGQGRPPDDLWAASDDPRASYGYLLAQHYGYWEARIAYGGYDWGGGMAGVPSLNTMIDQTTSTVSRLTDGMLIPPPDVALVNLGENGAPVSLDVTRALAKLRSRTGKTTKIIVMIPVSGRARDAVTSAFHSYKTESGDANAYLVDLGKIEFATADGQHPVAAGHQSIYKAALPFFDAIIGPAGATPGPAPASSPALHTP